MVFDAPPLFFSPFGRLCVHYDVLDVWSNKKKKKKKKKKLTFPYKKSKTPPVMSGDLGEKGQLM